LAKGVQTKCALFKIPHYATARCLEEGQFVSRIATYIITNMSPFVQHCSDDLLFTFQNIFFLKIVKRNCNFSEIQ